MLVERHSLCVCLETVACLAYWSTWSGSLVGSVIGCFGPIERHFAAASSVRLLFVALSRSRTASYSSSEWFLDWHETCRSGTVGRLGASRPLPCPKMRSMSWWALWSWISEEFCSWAGCSIDWFSQMGLLSYWQCLGFRSYDSLCSDSLSCSLQQGLICDSSGRPRWWTRDHSYSQSSEQTNSACASWQLSLKLCYIGYLSSWSVLLAYFHQEDC